jgi:hypothetical protein
MTQIFKLFVVKDEPYLTIDENVIIGDKAIVTVNGMFPSVVECFNDEQIGLFQNPFTKMTKRHKVVMGPNEFTIEEDLKQKLIMSETSINVEFENGEITIIE